MDGAITPVSGDVLTVEFYLGTVSCKKEIGYTIIRIMQR